MSGAGRSGRGTGRRRALLIGIGETPHVAADFPPLPCVDQDVERLRKVLAGSDYEVTACHPGHADPGYRDVGRSMLRKRLGVFLNSCGPGDTAFVYVTGHGMLVGGRDRLLPYDAMPDPGREGALDQETLLPADPAGLLLGSPDKDCTVVVCLDICRTRGPGPGDEEQRHLLSQVSNTLWLYGSSPGRAAYADPVQGSYFGRALASALSPDAPPKTFAEVASHTRGALRGLLDGARLSRPQPQQIESHLNRGAADQLELCEGSVRMSRWARAVTGSALWEHTSGSSDVHRRVQDQLVGLVEEVARAHGSLGSDHDDPWADPDDPGQVAARVVEQLGELVSRARLEEHDRLSPAETAVLLAAPVLHEYVTLVVLHELREVFDAAPDGPPPKDLQRLHDDALDDFRAHSQARRAAAALRGRGLHRESRAAEYWLRHRFVAAWDLPWEQPDEYPAVAGLIARTAAAVGTFGSGTVTASEVARRRIELQVRQVAGHLTVKPAGGPRINDTTRDARGDWEDQQPVPGQNWRCRELAQLLWTAGLLAADPRRMSGVLVDHLAAHWELRPATVCASLASELTWARSRPEGARDGEHLDVHFSCPHPALHSAVESLVAQADSSVRALHAGGPPPPLLRGVPHGVTARELRPQEGRYETPLERFRLAEEEIRPLLMGTQLYGDRMLAVRELYQNALDACRYRKMRVSYGRKGSPHPWWKPTIRFTQAVDEAHRPYIQCEDSGTGMSREQLTSMFARAGRRYEQDARFLQERRNWRRAGVDIIPLNSRFGIGVFSYFMLAEEVVVWSTPVDEHGDPEVRRSVRAEIQAGSGLLQFRRAEPAMPEGGTRVRLYLPVQDEQQPSVVETLREHLRVSDFPVTAEELDTAGGQVLFQEWDPGVLRRSAEWHGKALRAGADTWLVQGEGQVLLDGVLVKGAAPVHGYVVNLRERHRPEPSVDRNRMHSYDEEMVMSDLLAAVPAVAPAWEEVSLAPLWDLTAQEPRLAVALMTTLLKNNTRAVLEPDATRSLRIGARRPLSAIGCFPQDEAVASDSFVHRMFQPNRPHENRLLDDWHESRRGWGRGSQDRFQPAGYPDPEALDALLFRRPHVPEDCATAVRVAADARVSLRTALRALRRYAVAGVPVPSVPDIRALGRLRPTRIMAELYEAYTSRAADEAAAQGDISPSALHAPLVFIAVQHGLPFKEVVPLLEQLSAVDPALPLPPDLPDVVAGLQLRPDVATLVLAGARWLPGVLSPSDLPEWDTSPIPTKRLVQLFRQLAPLGFTLSPDWDATLEERPALPQRDRILMSADLSGHAPWRGETPGLRELVRMSVKLRISLGQLAAQLVKPLRSIGLDAPSVPAAVAGWTAPNWLAPSLEELRTDSLPFTPWQLVSRMWTEADELPGHGELMEDLRMLARCGLLLDDSPKALRSLLAQGATRLLSPVGSLSSYFDALSASIGDGTVSPAALIDLGEESHLSLGDAARALTGTASVLPLEVPEVPVEVQNLTPTRADQDALWESLPRRHNFTERLTILRLLSHAHRQGRHSPLSSTLHVLSQYTAIGAPPVPGDLTGPDADLLAEFVPTRFDLAAFDEGLLGPGTLGPLELVLLAGRFGWPLGKTFRRYAPFRCLGLDVTVREPLPREAALIPGWQDVILLTGELTGRAPALRGPVDPDHIQLCSEETGLSVREVRRHLAGYADLLGFQLPEEEDQPV